MTLDLPLLLSKQSAWNVFINTSLCECIWWLWCCYCCSFFHHSNGWKCTFKDPNKQKEVLCYKRKTASSKSVEHLWVSKVFLSYLQSFNNNKRERKKIICKHYLHLFFLLFSCWMKQNNNRKKVILVGILVLVIPFACFTLCCNTLLSI